MAFIMSLKMAFLMAFISILIHEGMRPDIFQVWIVSGFVSWCFAFPLAVIMGLLTHKFTLNKLFTLVED